MAHDAVSCQAPSSRVPARRPGCISRARLADDPRWGQPWESSLERHSRCIWPRCSWDHWSASERATPLEPRQREEDRRQPRRPGLASLAVCGLLRMKRVRAGHRSWVEPRRAQSRPPHTKLGPSRQRRASFRGLSHRPRVVRRPSRQGVSSFTSRSSCTTGSSRRPWRGNRCPSWSSRPGCSRRSSRPCTRRAGGRSH